MTDEKQGTEALLVPAPDNLRSLFYFMGVELDSRLAFLRKGATYGEARRSDARTLVAIARQQSTMSEVARRLGVSRQAVQSSVQRLIDLGLVSLAMSSADKRERLVIPTENGRAALRHGAEQIQQIEAEFAEMIGPAGVETLRKTMLLLLQQIQQRNHKDKAPRPFADEEFAAK